MSLTSHTIPNNGREEKLLTALLALLALLSLKIGLRAVIIGAFLVFVLWLFVLILGAIHQLCAQIAQIWTDSSPVEKLIIFLVAWAIFCKFSPAIARLIRKGV